MRVFGANKDGQGEPENPYPPTSLKPVKQVNPSDFGCAETGSDFATLAEPVSAWLHEVCRTGGVRVQGLGVLGLWVWGYFFQESGLPLTREHALTSYGPINPLHNFFYIL